MLVNDLINAPVNDLINALIKVRDPISLNDDVYFTLSPYFTNEPLPSPHSLYFHSFSLIRVSTRSPIHSPIHSHISHQSLYSISHLSITLLFNVFLLSLTLSLFSHLHLSYSPHLFLSSLCTAPPLFPSKHIFLDP